MSSKFLDDGRDPVGMVHSFIVIFTMVSTA